MGRRALWSSVVAVGLLAGTLSAQEAKPLFEVASIKPNNATNGPASFNVPAQGPVVAINVDWTAVHRCRSSNR
jgi:hypothetical protein